MTSEPPHLVVISGAGISAPSGVATFRDHGGLWSRVRLEDVATPEAFARDPTTVLSFYNQRRRQLAQVQPNAAHRALAALEVHFRVIVVTQNIDDLHERAGSSNVMHLHGELTRARSVADPHRLYDIGYSDMHLGQTGEDGSPLRPHVVWFGEPVPMMAAAAREVASADCVLVVGTSLQVYPAASLVTQVPRKATVTLIDPAPTVKLTHARHIRDTAANGVPRWANELKRQFGFASDE